MYNHTLHTPVRLLACVCAGGDMLAAWHTDVGVLAALCDLDPEW